MAETPQKLYDSLDDMARPTQWMSFVTRLSEFLAAVKNMWTAMSKIDHESLPPERPQTPELTPVTKPKRNYRPLEDSDIESQSSGSNNNNPNPSPSYFQSSVSWICYIMALIVYLGKRAYYAVDYCISWAAYPFQRIAYKIHRHSPTYFYKYFKRDLYFFILVVYCFLALWTYLLNPIFTAYYALLGTDISLFSKTVYHAVGSIVSTLSMVSTATLFYQTVYMHNTLFSLLTCILYYLEGRYLTLLLLFIFKFHYVRGIIHQCTTRKVIIWFGLYAIFAYQVNAKMIGLSTIPAICSPNSLLPYLKILANVPLYKGVIQRLPDVFTCDKVMDHADRLIQRAPIFRGLLNKNKPIKLHACRKNIIESIGRQFMCNVRPDPRIVSELTPIVEKVLQHVINQDVKLKTFDEWLEDYPGKIKNEYKSAIQRIKQGKHSHVASMKCFSKTDEKLFYSYANPKVKARNITSQASTTKVLTGYLMYIITVHLKKLKAFASGLSPEQMSTRMTEVYEKVKGANTLCIDGSAYDSTQHDIIYKTVNVPFYEAFIDKFNYLFPDWLDRNLLLQAIRNVDQKVRSRKYKIKYLVKGTQATGAMDTTLGNTLRNIIYQLYIYSKIVGIDNILKDNLFSPLAMGDDTWIAISNSIRDEYIRLARRYVYWPDASNKVVHGLGQVAKIFDVSDTIDGTEFCSTYVFKVNQKVVAVRKPERQLQSISWTPNNRLTNIRKFHRLNHELAWMEGTMLQHVDGHSAFKTLGRKLIELGIKPSSTAARKVECKKKREHWKVMTNSHLSEREQKILDSKYEEFFLKKYCIPPTLWKTLERQFNTIESIYDTKITEVVDYFVAHKLDDYHELHVADRLDTITAINKAKLLQFFSQPGDVRILDTHPSTYMYNTSIKL